MNSRSISWFSFLHLLFIIKVLVLQFQASSGSGNPDELPYQACRNTYSCGDTIRRIGYPFRGHDDPPYCGHPSLVLTCDDQKNVTNIVIMSTKYRVLEIKQKAQIMRIAREDVMEENCPSEMVNTTLDHSIFDYDASCKNFTFLYGCPHFMPGFNIPCGDHVVYVFPESTGPGFCNASVIVPINPDEGGGPPDAMKLHQALLRGFEIRWKIDSKPCSDCTASKGRCVCDLATNQTTCYCPAPLYNNSGTCTVDNGASPTPDQTPTQRSKYSGFYLTYNK